MGLKEYIAKRDFRKTSEPEGSAEKPTTQNVYVMHKHDASHLHYDLRLELDGVLKSWAVPKGPDVDPKEKRLAVQVEDHPLDYGGFEGTIPKGEYGGGTVMLWDQGQWAPIGDAHAGLAKGHLDFELFGKKLRGKWSLIRIGGVRGNGESGKANWLLRKLNDATAQPGGGKAFLDEHALSVLTGRSMEQIAAGEKPKKQARQTAEQKEFDPSGLTGARKASQPEIMDVQLATLVDKPPEGENWLHEVKLDGYRILCVLKGEKARLYSRNGNDWTDAFASIAQAAQHLPVEQAILDGEVVMLNAQGISDFQALQNFLKGGRQTELVYFVFDIPHCNGYDLTATPLLERKTFLRQLFEKNVGPHPLRYSDHFAGQGQTVYEHACQFGLEGIISKRANSAYQSRRTKDWLKVKCRKRQEFVIGGYTDPGGSREHFGALLLGYYEDGDLIYCGRAGTGFTEKTLERVFKELKIRLQNEMSFKNWPDVNLRKAHWVRPELVAEVEFAQWTNEGILRQAAFQGLREDKDPHEVVREEPEPAPAQPKPAAAPKARSAVAGIHLTHPDRILYPSAAITKKTLAEFYESIGHLILPHLAGRPLMLLRCPDGVGSECFHQKHFRDMLPKGVHTVDVPEKSTVRKYAVVNDVSGLISLVQLGVLEFHAWGCREDKLEMPDRMIFDLDPGPGVPWEAVIECARTLRALLEWLSLRSYVKTSGGKGLHVMVPFQRRLNWADMGTYARTVAETLARKQPKLYTATMRKDRRHGKVFIDHFRNGRGATCAVAYSTRARVEAPVSVPISWEELAQVDDPAMFTVANLQDRLGTLQADPWDDFFSVRQTLRMKDIEAMKRA